MYSIYGVEVINEHIQRLMYSTATVPSAPRGPATPRGWTTGKQRDLTREKYLQSENSALQNNDDF